MQIDKKAIIENVCYSELVYGRINKKLKTNYSNIEIERLIKIALTEAFSESFCKKGKNYYIENHLRNIRITINSSTNRVITVDLIKI